MHKTTGFSLLFLAMFATGGADAASSVRMLGLNGTTGEMGNTVAAPVRNATGAALTRKSTAPLRTRTIPATTAATTNTNTSGSNRISISPAKLVPVKGPTTNGSQAINTGGTGTPINIPSIDDTTINQLIGRFDTFENRLDSKLDASALSDYYTKTEIDEIGDAFYTTAQVDDKVSDINRRINTITSNLQEINATLSNEGLSDLVSKVNTNANSINELQQQTQTIYNAATGQRMLVHVIDDFNDNVLTQAAPASGQQDEGI